MKGLKVFLLFLIAIGAGVALWKHGAIPQSEAYHHFADTRPLHVGSKAIPNAFNVLSNIPFFIVGWIGLVVPHLARFVVGPAFDRLLPVAVLMGAGMLVLVDDVARSATAMELPLGVLTSLIGAPFLLFLVLRKKDPR